MSEKSTFLETLRLHFIKLYLLHADNCVLDQITLYLPILDMHLFGQDLHSAWPMCPQRLTLHFIAAMIFFVDIL